jgi:hypothetical protein
LYFSSLSLNFSIHFLVGSKALKLDLIPMPDLQQLPEAQMIFQPLLGVHPDFARPPNHLVRTLCSIHIQLLGLHPQRLALD